MRINKRNKKKNKKIIVNLSRLKYFLIFSLLIFVLAVFAAFLFLSKGKGRVSSVDFSSELEKRMYKMVSGYPIQDMASSISSKDRMVAAYLVAIAKKESNWGKRSPMKDGETCYNYWGYRGTYNQTDSGYSCFDSPQQAVNVVGKRIKDLIDKDVNSPKKMAVAWKCGWNCSGHSYFSVKKWEWDVGYYFNKIYN